jgi:(p)ppGpp synthase/HD superfamily hydrolase
VASLVIEGGGSETQAIAGLLHDAVEDQGRDGRTLVEIRDRFGNDVADIVMQCSDTDEEPKPPWKPRKETYIAHLRTARDDTILVSLADKLDNARALLRDYRVVGDRLWERFSEHEPGEHLWYYQSLLEIFQARNESWLVAELDRVVAELRRLVSASTAEPSR